MLTDVDEHNGGMAEQIQRTITILQGKEIIKTQL